MPMNFLVKFISDYSSQPMCFYDASKKEGIHDLMFRVRAFNVTFYETIKKNKKINI